MAGFLEDDAHGDRFQSQPTILMGQLGRPQAGFPGLAAYLRQRPGRQAVLLGLQRLQRDDDFIHKAADAINQTRAENRNRAAKSSPRIKDEAMKISGCSKSLSRVKPSRRGISPPARGDIVTRR